jgi:hypothetical protein
MARLLAFIFFGPLAAIWCLVKDGGDVRRLGGEVARLRQAREVDEFLRNANMYRKT